MFIEPRIQVNPVEYPTPAQTDAGHTQLREQRDPDAEIHRRLFL
jgi:hypothetical protein